MAEASREHGRTPPLWVRAAGISLGGAVLLALLHPLPPVRGIAADLFHLTPAAFPFAVLLLGFGFALFLPAVALALWLCRRGIAPHLTWLAAVAVVVAVLLLYPLLRAAILAPRYLESRSALDVVVVREAPEQVEVRILRAATLRGVVRREEETSLRGDLFVRDFTGALSVFGGDPFLREPDRPEDLVTLVELARGTHRALLEELAVPLLLRSRPIETVYDRTTLELRHPRRRGVTVGLRGRAGRYHVFGSNERMAELLAIVEGRLQPGEPGP